MPLLNLVCNQCGSIFQRRHSNVKKTGTFCSKSCWYTWKKEHPVGENHHFYRNGLLQKTCVACATEYTTHSKRQKYCSRECYLKVHTANTQTYECEYCGATFSRRIGQVHNHTFCSKECYNKGYFGDKHWRWITDRTQLRKTTRDIRKSTEMKTWRLQVFERDNYTCQLCGVRGGNLHPHHIIKLSKCSDDDSLIFDINNGITLCENCHQRTYNREEHYEYDCRR